MKPTKISVSYGKTVNTGNFNSLRLDAGIEVELEEGDTAGAAYEAAYAAAKAAVAEQIARASK